MTAEQAANILAISPSIVRQLVAERLLSPNITGAEMAATTKSSKFLQRLNVLRLEETDRVSAARRVREEAQRIARRPPSEPSRPFKVRER